ncbi:MAG: sugar ABC transporter substrate-binding protein [Acetivibrionales bacterium]|jgi:ribose transport system substrate-binding protein
MKKVLIGLLAMVLVFAFAACDTQEKPAEQSPVATEAAPSQAAAPAEIRIGCIPADSDIEFFQKLAKGMEDAGKDLGITVDIQYTGRSVEEELRLTELFISQGYDGIVLESVDSAAMLGCVQKAKAAGLAFVAADTVPDDTTMCDSTVASDNYAGGVEAGKLMKKLLPNGGDVLMVKFQSSSISTDERYQGFEDEIKDSNIRVIDSVATDGSRDDALAKITPMLSQYPDLDGIFCCQGDPAIGALTAVETAGMQDTVKILAYDIEGEVAAAIAGGKALCGGVTQFPYEMGYLSVVNCYKAIMGEKVEQVVKMPVLQVSADQMEEFTADTTAYLAKYGNFTVK